ncbi:MAG: hypothetical protein WBK44_00530 [Smithellaceae bacterium]|nr:hypothetical protein [Syntrophaceae bacterium]MBP8608802.1 hypothetical protein [Syntrophaceae bacterium]OQA90875.1 MAG: hypothetical protein BWY26_01332 [Elusimicrobia bacterium ADurb.Bin231]
MTDKIITGTIKNNETGEVYDIVPFYYFTHGAELNTIVKILSVKSTFNEKAEPAIQVNIDCLALDSIGNVFKLNLYFLPECLEDQKIIVAEITEGKIMTATGRYSILTNDKGSVMLIDPQYSPLPPEYSLEEVEEAFRINNQYNKNRLN